MERGEKILVNKYNLKSLFVKILFPVLCLVFLIYYYINTKDLHYLSLVYPRIIMIGLLGVVVWDIYAGVTKWKQEKDKTEKIAEKDNIKAILIYLGTAFYIFMISRLGFGVCTFLYLGFMLYYLGVRKIISLILYTTLTSAAIYIVFTKLLSIPFPSGILF